MQKSFVPDFIIANDSFRRRAVKFWMPTTIKSRSAKRFSAVFKRFLEAVNEFLACTTNIAAEFRAHTWTLLDVQNPEFMSLIFYHLTRFSGVMILRERVVCEKIADKNFVATSFYLLFSCDHFYLLLMASRLHPNKRSCNYDHNIFEQ